jgi:type IV pilus assembly protein PilM
MAKVTDAWGIEVGANALKAIRLAVGEDGSVHIIDHDIMEFKNVLTTPDVDADDAIQVQLDKFLASHDVANCSVVVSLPGHMAFARFAKLPPVEAKKIPDIVKFEAVQQIPFPIHQVSWDYQVFQEEDSPDVEVGIFAITKDRVSEFLNNYRAVNLDVDCLTLSPLAVYNALYYDLELDVDSPGCIFMDIGTTATDVIIVENGRIWLRTLPIGGNNFTDALVKSFKLSFSKAEKLKREAGTSKYARQIFQATRPVFADLVQEMQRSLGFYQSLNRDAELTKLIGVGSTFKLPGLIKFLKQQLQLEVIRPNKFERLEIDDKREADFSKNAMMMATAYGLALQGLELERVSANVMPSYIIKQRLWRAKQPFFGAAAAVMLAASAGAFYTLWSQESAHGEAMTAGDAKIDQVDRMAKSYQDKLGTLGRVDQRHRIENLRRILDYRNVWPQVIADISSACKDFMPGEQQDIFSKKEWAGITGIPRNDRWQIVVKQISGAYRVNGPNFKALPPVSKMTTNENEIWGAKVADAQAAAPDANSTDPQGLVRPPVPVAPGGSAKVKVITSERQGPEFVITLKGYTTIREAPRHLNKKLLKWFKDNAKKQGRAYDITVTKNSLISVNPMPEDKKEVAVAIESEGTRLPKAGPVLPNFGSKGGRFDPSSVGEDPKNTKPTLKLSASDLNQLLPQRPTAEEERKTDWEFEIQILVQLKRTSESRLTSDQPAPEAE